MTRRTRPLGLALVLVGWLTIPCGATAQVETAEILVKLRDSRSAQAEAALRSRGAQRVDRMRRGTAGGARRADAWRRIRLGPNADVDAVLRALEADPRVEKAVRNRVLEPFLSPDDTRYGEQWALDNTGQTGGTVDADIDAPAAWDDHTGDGSVVVAVLDTGVAYTHPDLAGNIWSNTDEIAGNSVDDDGNGYVDDVRGYNFIADTADPAEPVLTGSPVYHGTPIAGIIGAVGDNATGIAGVNWDVQIMPLKIGVFFAFGLFTTCADIAEAMSYAIDNGARIMNMSIGAFGEDACPPIDDAAWDANEAGVLIVTAAGNNGADIDDPGFFLTPQKLDLPNVITVASTNHNDGRAGDSNYGAVSVDLGAPGVGVLTTIPGGAYATVGGTSFAAPYVAGAAALVWSYRPALDPVDVKAALMMGGDGNASLSGITVSGRRLNLDVALGLANVVGGDLSKYLACDDGVDNDGDALVDYPDDPGCSGLFGVSPKEDPKCNDGIDNDGDTLVDLADPNCTDATDDKEAPDGCGIGFELVALAPIFRKLRRRAPRGS
jgi:subtilisin family serine protease